MKEHMKLALAEFIGTVIFITVVLKYAPEPEGEFKIGLMLTACIIMASIFNAGHLNPAVTLASLIKGEEEDKIKLVVLVCGQLLGACAAGFLSKHVNSD